MCLVGPIAFCLEARTNCPPLLMQLTPKEESAHAARSGLLPRLHSVHHEALHGHPAAHHGHYPPYSGGPSGLLTSASFLYIFPPDPR